MEDQKLAVQFDAEDSRIDVLLGFSSVWEMARNKIREAQERYKGQYGKKATPVKVNIGDRVFVKKEVRRKGKLSCLFEGPYCVAGSGSNTVQVRPITNRQQL